MNKTTLLTGLAALSRLFPARNVDAVLAWEYLNDLSDNDFNYAIEYIGKNMPEINQSTNVIAVIRNTALSRQHQSPTAAWAIVQQHIREVGYYGTPHITDKHIADTVKAIGWRTLCEGTDKENRYNFIQTYNDIVSSSKSQSHIDTTHLLEDNS